jgi:hypothetical protein
MEEYWIYFKAVECESHIKVEGVASYTGPGSILS